VRALTSRERIETLMRELGRAARVPTRAYLTGGASAVLLGWRDTTLDVDLTFVPDSDELFRAIAELKTRLSTNIEIASPADFVPPLPGWEGRCAFIVLEGRVSFHHYDFYAQALSKLERGHAQDRIDVAAMRSAGLVDPAELLRLFEQIEPALIRYPAINPPTLRRAVESFADS
jgi:hypothetical protein